MKNPDEFYLGLAHLVSQQSYAEDHKVGAVIVKDDNIISFSYNGTARGSNNSTEVNGKTLPTVLHAEAQAIAKVARSNNSTNGATLYCTLSPCIECAKLIYASGVTRVAYQGEYKNLSGIIFLKENNIRINRDPPLHMRINKTWQSLPTGLFIND